MSRRPTRHVADPVGARQSIPPFPENIRRALANQPPRGGSRVEALALPGEDPAEIAHRFAAFEAETRPTGEIGRCLARRAALMSVRLDRLAVFEAATTGKRVRDAARAYEDGRRVAVEKMADWIAAEPATHARRLRNSPEGIDWLIRAWNAVKSDLFHPTRDVWDAAHRRRIDNLMGRRPEDFPISPIDPLCKAVWGDFSDLADHQGGDMAAPARREWAREQVGRLIDAEVAALEAARAGLDLDAIDQDRAEAAGRALFAASPEAVLARKYEAATERALFRALRELKAIESAAGRIHAGEQAAVEPGAENQAEPGRGSLASFFPAEGFALDQPGDVGGWEGSGVPSPSGRLAPTPAHPHQR